jgi:hypothetical protein
MGTEETLPPEESSGFVLSEFHTFLKARPARDAFLSQQHYFGGVPCAVLAEQMGLPVSTVSQLLKTFKDQVIALRESQTRPHAAD